MAPRGGIAEVPHPPARQGPMSQGESGASAAAIGAAHDKLFTIIG
jgi:hypothetical protein